MADSTHYFVRHIDVYQGNNAGSIDINARAANPPTTIKAVVIVIITIGVGNDHDGARKMFLDHSYACPKILAILEDGLNVITGGTCRKNNKGLPGKYDNLNLPKGCEMGGFKRIYNLHLCLVATQCKYSNTILFISSLSKLEKMEVTQHRGQELITVQCPMYISEYQKKMDGGNRKKTS